MKSSDISFENILIKLENVWLIKDKICSAFVIFWQCCVLKSRKFSTWWIYTLWAITGHGSFPTYYRKFRIRPKARMCSFCTSPYPATSKHLLVECGGTQPLKKQFCPRLTSASVRNSFVEPDMRKCLAAFLKEMGPHLWW